MVLNNILKKSDVDRAPKILDKEECDTYNVCDMKIDIFASDTTVQLNPSKMDIRSYFCVYV